jgi:hypothetical protein
MWVKLIRPFYTNETLIPVGVHEFADGFKLPAGATIVNGPELPTKAPIVVPVALSELGKQLNPATNPVTGRPVAASKNTEDDE